MPEDQLPPSPVGKPDRRENASHKPAEHADHARGKVPIVPAPIKANSQKTPYHYEVTCKTEKNWWDKAKPFVELVGILLLAAYTVYTIKMYSVNKIAADAAASAADTARRTLVIGNRSWIETTLDPDFKKKSDTKKEMRDGLKEMAFPVRFTNIGKAPVKNITIEATTEILPAEASSTLSFAGTDGLIDTGQQNILYPTRFWGIPVQRYASGAKALVANNKVEPITPMLREELRLGEKYFVVYVRGTFEDDLGRHWFKYCHWISLNDVPHTFAARNCTDFNGTGDF
jgi:hypothetical protein